VLPIALPAETVSSLFDAMYAQEGYELEIDLDAQIVRTPDGEEIAFEVDSFRKHCLFNGLDDIGLTLQSSDAIRDFEQRWQQQSPWLFGTIQ
jgi:3-isopropylmalate/(R)-2-methylmalate dehydratase small subunit